MDYTNTRDDGILSLDTYISYNQKVDTPGTKPDTTGVVLDSKSAAVPFAKGAADKKNIVT